MKISYQVFFNFHFYILRHVHRKISLFIYLFLFHFIVFDLIAVFKLISQAFLDYSIPLNFC
jgi:hypothetical protein